MEPRVCQAGARDAGAAKASPPCSLAASSESFSAAVQLQDVSKIYGGFAALRHVSARIEAGSSTVVLGENGAGKSTLLRVIAGLIAPTLGTVSTFGLRPSEARRRMAYMSHASMLYDELSAMENLTYFAGLYRDEGCDCVASPEMALRAVGLDPGLKRPVGQYSQGMRQRTSLARVLQSDPELLLLDEPFSNLDVASARQMVELLVDFRTWPVAGGGKRTIVMTTHQAKLAEPLAQATLTMRSGTLLEQASA